MLKGLNHITFAIQDLERSVDFYCCVLGFELCVLWDQGAYVTIGDCWVCLSQDEETSPSGDYSHVAFTLDADDFDSFSQMLSEEGVEIWKRNTSEGSSVYFLDPDGHKLEAHVGNLESRMKSIQRLPYKGQRILS